MASGYIKAGVAPVSEGGTGMTVSAIVSPYNGGTSLLDYINAYRETASFPLSISKEGTATWSDLPSNYQNMEGNFICFGQKNRLTVFYIPFTSNELFMRRVYNGEYQANVGWRKIAFSSL